MARTLDAILSELGSTYDPQIQSIQRRQADIPGQIQVEEQGLRAQEQDYFDNTIMGGARRRGVGFSGIPEGERARYGSTQFLPALARLRQSGREQAMSLEDALNGIYERRNTTAQSIKQNELNLDEQRRQFDTNLALQREQMAAQQRSAASVAPRPSMGFSPSSGGSSMPEGMTERRDKLGNFNGFNFNVGGKAASAGQYASANKIPIGDLLYNMASRGDQTAANAYRWIQSIQGTDAFKSGAFKNTPAYKNTFSSIFWGT